MSPVYSARRAERFHALIEGSASAPADRRTAELVAVVGALRSAAGTPPAPRPEFVADLRERLLAAAATELAPGTPPPSATERPPVRTPTRRSRRLSAALAGLAMLGASATMAVASQGALPGDALYPIKQALEGAGTRIAANDVERGHSLLDRADNRLEELHSMAAEGDPHAAAVVDTLDTFTTQSLEGSRLLLDDARENGTRSSAERVLEFAGASTEQLAALREQLPADADAAFLRAARTVVAIDATATQVCPTCGGAPLEVPMELLAGATGPGGSDATVPGVPSPSATAASDHLGLEDLALPGATGLGTAVADVLPTGATSTPHPGTSPTGSPSPDGPTSGPTGNPSPDSTDPTDPPAGEPTGGPDGGDQTEGGLHGTAGQVVDGVQDTTGQVTQGVGETLDNVAGGDLSGAGQAVGNTVSGAGQAAGSAVGGATSQLGNTVGGVGAGVGDTLGQVTGNVVGQGAGQAVGDAVGGLGETAGNAVGGAGAAVGGLVEDTTCTVASLLGGCGNQ